MNAIKEILMSRDGMDEKSANDLITKAREALYEYIECGDSVSADYVCEEFFCLEPDYIMELM